MKKRGMISKKAGVNEVMLLSVLIISVLSFAVFSYKDIKTNSESMIYSNNTNGIEPEISNIQKSAQTLNLPESYTLETIPNLFEIKLGKEFHINIEPVSNTDPHFSDNTYLFDINSETGELKFTPNEIGEFVTVIIELNSVENFRYKLIIFRVIE